MKALAAFLKRKSVRLALAGVLTVAGTAAATGNLDVPALLSAIASAFAPDTTPLQATPPGAGVTVP